MSDETTSQAETPLLSGPEHYKVASKLLSQLSEQTSESFEEHAANIEVINTATVHAHLAMADLLDDIAKALVKLNGTLEASSKRVETRLGNVEKHLKVVR